MFSSKLRVGVGTVAAIGALSVTGVAGATIIAAPGGGTTPQPIKTNPTKPRVQVGVAVGSGAKRQSICDGWENTLNGDIDTILNATTPDAKDGAAEQYFDDYTAALDAGCFVLDPPAPE